MMKRGFDNGVRTWLSTPSRYEDDMKTFKMSSQLLLENRGKRTANEHKIENPADFLFPVAYLNQ